MKWYADTPERRSRQIAADVFVAVWIGVWVWLATRLHDLLLDLAGPGTAVAETGQELADSMGAAATQVAALPVVGAGLREPFDRMSQAGRTLADAGAAQEQAIAHVALFAAICLAVVPIALLLVIWLPLRVRFVRRAHAAQRYIDEAADLDLFALRALARQPMHVLARIHDDPAGAWRRRDPEVLHRLAELELRTAGLVVPPGLRLD